MTNKAFLLVDFMRHDTRPADGALIHMDMGLEVSHQCIIERGKTL